MYYALLNTKIINIGPGEDLTRIRSLFGISGRKSVTVGLVVSNNSNSTSRQVGTVFESHWRYFLFMP